ncbi:MAG: M48 family peptidase [Acidobacteria bacterium]|nr:M48 family peptidase [Acidobacteriota bacterium]
MAEGKPQSSIDTAEAPVAPDPESRIRALFAETICLMGRRKRAPEIEIGFHAFAGLNSYIRIRNQKVVIRISDILLGAPLEVLRALARILVAKLFRQKVDGEATQVYSAFVSDPAIRSRVETARGLRGRKRLTAPQGRYRDLDRSFDRLNREFFGGNLPKPRLSWSQQKARTVLGHTDHVHDTIVISRRLDSPSIPNYLFEFVLYHEMLHLKHGSRLINGKRYCHTRAFRADERRFPSYLKASARLGRLSNPLG